MVELHFERTYAAPQNLVWDAWTDPDQMAQWWGPRGLSTPRDSIELDLRPGGVVRFDMVDDATGERYPNSGRFLEVEPPSRIVWADDGFPDGSGKGTATIVFEAVDETTTRLTVHLGRLHRERPGRRRGRLGLATGQAGRLPRRAGAVNRWAARLPSCGARDRPARARAARRRRRPPRSRGVLRAGPRRRNGASAHLSRPPGNGPDERARDDPERRRRARHAARPRRRGHGRDYTPPDRPLGGRVLRPGDGLEATGAGRRPGARLSVVAGRARRPGASCRRRLGRPRRRRLPELLRDPDPGDARTLRAVCRARGRARRPGGTRADR